VLVVVCIFVLQTTRMIRVCSKIKNMTSIHTITDKVYNSYRPPVIYYRNKITSFRGGDSLFDCTMKDIQLELPQHIKLKYDNGIYTFSVYKDGFLLFSYRINKFVGLYNFQMKYWYETGNSFCSYFSFICDYWFYPPVNSDRIEYDITGGCYDYYKD